MKKLSSNKSGMSLIEVLVALLVVTMGLLIVLGCFPVIARSIDKTSEDRNLVLLAQSVMDRLLMDNNFIQVKEVVEKDLPRDILKELQGRGTITVKYRGEVPLPTATNPKYQRVHVEVTLSRPKTPKKIKLTGVICP
jgi:prepilin-type N-terminal cleavage/methylation domain-containing protein